MKTLEISAKTISSEIILKSIMSKDFINLTLTEYKKLEKLLSNIISQNLLVKLKE